ncbi:MAG: hypothetical protein K6F75_12955 [Butyrivibrio sp.]|nr:hypothetical protein [Butyrivibrio sp.]
MGESTGNENNTAVNTFGTAAIIKGIMLIAAFVLGIVGIVRITDIYRIIIYAGQCIICVALFLFGVLKFKDVEGKFLKITIISYAILEALRASLINVTGVHFAVGVIARFILASLACTCVLMAERMGKESGKRTAIGMLTLEVILYVVFLAGFKGILLGRINRFLPLIGVLIAGTIALLHKEKTK